MTLYGSLSPDLRQETQESIRILDMVDLDLSHYFDINVDEDATYTLFSPKIGDIRMQDPDDSGNTDYIQFTMDVAAGAILHNTSMITDGNVHRILASGTFNGTAATRSVNYLELDLDGITVNDAAANAVTLKGMNVDFNGLTATAVGLSSIYGLSVELPTIMSTWAGGYGVRVAENTNDMVAELVNHSGYGLYLYGDTSNSGRTWMNVTPSTQTITADVNNKYLNISMANLTINDGANTPEFYGIDANMTAGTQTAVDGTILYGARFLMPDISAYGSGAGLQITENTTDSIVEIVNKANNAIKIYGANVEARDWFLIQPSASTIIASNTINYGLISNANITINDGANTPTIRGLYLDLDGETQTAVDGTTFNGLQIDVKNLVGYSAAAALQVNENTNDTVVEIVNKAYNALKIVGDKVDVSRNWVVVQPSTSTINSTVSHNFITVDLDNLVIDDGATTPTIRGFYGYFDEPTSTGVDGTTFLGMDLVMPRSGAYLLERGLQIVADKTTANNANTIFASRDINGTVAGAVALTNYANALSQVVNHTGGDFIVTQTAATAGTLNVELAHTLNTGAATAGADVFASTALNIDVDATVAGNAGSQLTTTARALDISYALTETLGVMLLGGTDVARIAMTLPTGVAATGAVQVDILELNADAVTLNDANYTFNVLNIDASDLTNTSSTAARLINLTMPDDSNATVALNIVADTTTANSQRTILTSRDINGTVAGAVALTNYANVLGQAVTHSGGDFVVTQTADTAGIMQLNLEHNLTIDTAAADVCSSTALDINVTPTCNHATGELNVGARALDINYLITNTAGTTTLLADVDVARIVLDSAGTDWACGAVSWDILELNANSFIANDADFTLRGLNLDFTTITLTAFAAFYGEQISVPTLTGASSGLHVIENTNDRTVDLITPATSILLGGDTIESGSWLSIVPSAATINAGNTINLVNIDTDAWIINDAATSPIIRAIYANLDDMTETDVNGTTLYGLRLDIPNITGYVAGSAGLSVNNTAGGKFEVLPQTGEVCYITPSGNVDALEIDLTNNAWTSASAIDINIGDWIGGSNIIDISATQAGTVATNAAMQKIDMGTNVTFTDGGAATQFYYGLNIQAAAITAAHANFAGLAGINIAMPANGHAAWGGNKTSAIHATGNGNTFDALLGDGIKLTMTEAASIGVDLISDASNLANAMQTIVSSRDITGALTADRAMTVYSVAHSINNVNTTAGDFDLSFASGGVQSITMSQTCSTDQDKTHPDTFAGTALLIDVDAVTNTNANAELDCTARALDISYALTETLGTLRLGTTDVVRVQSTLPNLLSSAGAFNYNLVNIDANDTLNDINMTYALLNLDASGLTYTSAAASYCEYINSRTGMTAGLYVKCQAVTDPAITTDGEIVAGNLAATQYMPFQGLETSDEVTVTVTTQIDSSVGTAGAGVANTRHQVVKVLATAGAPDTVKVWFQYEVPADYKNSLDDGDIYGCIAGYDAVGGPAVIGTVAVNVYTEAQAGPENTGGGTACNITGGAAATNWALISALSTPQDHIPTANAAHFVPGTKVMVEYTVSITTINDYMEFTIPRIKYARIS